MIIGGRPERRGSVIDCSSEAASHGIYPSLLLSQAYCLCPEAVFIDFEKERYHELWETILFALGTFSLRVQSDDCGSAYLDMTSRPQTYKSETLLACSIEQEMGDSFGIKTKIGIGNSRFVAGQAALHASDRKLIIEPGQEKNFLFPLSVNDLPVLEEAKKRLNLLGIKTLGKVASLSREALVSQFGMSGNQLWELACGAEDRRRIPIRKNAVYYEKKMLSETPLKDAPLLSSHIASLLKDLAAELKQAKWLCRKLKLLFDLDNRGVVEKTAVFKRPTSDAKEMLRRVYPLFDRVVLESPICAITLQVSEVCMSEIEQETLFRRRPDFLQKLEGVRDHLDALYGYTPLFKIEEDDRDSRLPERKFVFREV